MTNFQYALSAPIQPRRAAHRNTARSRGVKRSRRSDRRGVVALWVILVTPAFLLLLCFVADIGKLWLSRTELENALEATALAGVRSWGEAGGGPTLNARGTATQYAAANTIGGNSLLLGLNHNSGNLPNENDQPTGSLLFGSATAAGTNWIFNPAGEPDCNASRPYAVRAQSTAAVTSLCNGFLGITFGPYSISAEATAIYDCNTNQPRIVASP